MVIPSQEGQNPAYRLSGFFNYNINVIPAKAGISLQLQPDSGFRRNDDDY